MKAWMLAAMLFLASLPALARAPADPDEAGIRQVIERFRTAIIERDKPRFLALFLEGGVSWQSTLSDEGLVRIREKNPKAIKLRVNPANNPTSFIDEVVADKASSEETFDNIRIDSDGDVAAVTFDYRFLSDGKETNHGKEAWQLIRTAEGWRIVSVIWSVNLPPKS